MYGVMAIGNALVDNEYVLSDDQLALTGLAKGSMTLAGLEEQKMLLALIVEHNIALSKQAGGGSAANAMFAFASLGGQAFYGCRVGDDAQGKFYLSDLNQAGVDTSELSITQGGVTGSCIVCVTPDGERTMQTFLGTSSEISEENLEFEVLPKSDWLYLEGYLAMSPSIQPAIVKLRQQAGVHGVKVAVSFSDPAVVRFAKESLTNMLGNGVETIFCNLEEAQLFTGKKQHKAVAKALTDYCQIAVVTNGENGAIICQRQDSELQLIEVPTPKVANLVDTNGAGDNYAGAFLYALSQHYSLPECGSLASEIASQVVQRFGSRLPSTEYFDIARRILAV